MTARDIVNLLAAKHAEDVFIDECKNGPSWGSTMCRMDAWAMNRSWVHLNMTGYEVKISRQDFLNDNKWHGYLSLCNQFWFVAPKGIIKPDEVPADAGLMEPASTGKHLFTRKKAPWRKIEPPTQLLFYIIMCRSNFKSGHHFQKEDQSAYWRSWLTKKQEDRQLGYDVSRAIREHVVKVEVENTHLKQINRNLQEVKEFCTQHFGLGSDEVCKWIVQSKTHKMQEVVDQNLQNQLAGLKHSIETVQATIETLKKEAA